MSSYRAVGARANGARASDKERLARAERIQRASGDCITSAPERLSRPSKCAQARICALRAALTSRRAFQGRDCRLRRSHPGAAPSARGVRWSRAICRLILHDYHHDYYGRLVIAAVEMTCAIMRALLRSSRRLSLVYCVKAYHSVKAVFVLSFVLSFYYSVRAGWYV
jgi:hypothetical protein